MDYDVSLELPSARFVENRAEAVAIRSRVKARALAVVHAVMGPQVKQIYKAELALEIERLGNPDFEGRPEPAGPARERKKLLSEEEAKALPGSGLLPGETYWDWMETYSSKDDEQWSSEKVTVKKNLESVQKGASSGS